MSTVLPALRVHHSESEQPIVSWTGGVSTAKIDVLAVEEPLEIRLAGFSVAVTMRTPGHDRELAAGFLFTEGIIHTANDIDTISVCQADDAESQGNIINVNPRDPAIVDPSRWQRNFFTTSSCGICGKASIESVRQEAPPIRSDLSVPYKTVYGLEEQLRGAQSAFDKTGGLHGAGLFDRDGRLLVAREDVGRHNAVDKVIGHALLGEANARTHRLPLSDLLLMVSGRLSFEIVQKALMAGIPLVAAVSAPSSLAVELARSADMTLVGFLRHGRFNVYAGQHRIIAN